MDAKAEKLALFRYGVIAPLVIEILPRGELTRRAQEIAARHYDIPDSKRTAVSVDTLLDWAGRYRNGGFEALAPKPRQDRGQSRAVTPQRASLIERRKRENPHRTGTTLLLLTGEVGSGKSTAARTFTTALNPNLYKILYLHWTPGSTLDLLRQLALELDLEPAHYRGDLVRQISQAIVRLNQSKKQHPILICDEAQLLCHSALEQLPLLLNFDMDSSRYLTLLLVGQPLLRRTLSLQMHEPLRQRIAVQYHLEGLTREELDAYLAHQLKAAGAPQPLFDDTARQALYQATKGILRKVNKLALTALRLAASRKESTVGESILLDATTEALL